jgi:hypothetical protein
MLVFLVAVLSGARNQQNGSLAEQIVDRMKTLFPDQKAVLTSASILLANVYGSLGDREKAADIRTQLNQSGAKKKAGRSWTVPDGKIYVSLFDCLVIFLEVNGN